MPPSATSRLLLWLIAFVVVCESTGRAQVITPVWEYLINKLPSPLPILTNATPYTADDENGDGRSLMDCIGPMRRYDTNRLILGIRENGIDETQVHDTNLANAYPDRSLIWINPTNGAPMGIALNMGLFPVPLDTNIVAAGGVPGSYYWSFDVSDDGYVYSGYKNQIIRYAPDLLLGTISPTPTVVFTLDQNTATNNGVSPAQWSGFRWAHVRVRGAGANTKILAGGIGARGVWLLTTTNGSTFTAGAHLNGGFGNAAGNVSNLLPGRDPAAPDDLWFYGGSYPGNSNGSDTRFNRATASPPFDDPAHVFVNDSTFAAQVDPNTNGFSRYTGTFSGSVDAHPNFDFLVHYSAPAYNHNAVGGYQPGWLAVHDLTNGTFIAAHQLPVTEADELLTTDNTALFIGCLGSVSMYPMSDGTAEILWTSEIYGYGRYIVGSPRYSRIASMTKNIQPLWEQLQGQPNLRLPIITTNVNSSPVPSDGRSVMHVFTGLKKYDSMRLLLGIRDNGINESLPHNTTLASQFPDRSLQWIDADTGGPLGTALVISYPAGTVGDDRHLNMAFGVDAAGVLYVGVANTIRRYAPSGGGFAASSVAFTQTAAPPSAVIDKVQFSELRIKGSGSNTVIVAGNRDWYGDVDHVLTTTDGLTFTEQTVMPTGFGTGGGGLSSIVPDIDAPSDNLIYRTSFPSTSNGADTRFHRRRQAGGTGDFSADVFAPEQVPGNSISNSVDVIYRTMFETDVQTLPGLDYVVTYSTPSFRTFHNPDVQNALKGSAPNPMPYQPGWIAIHDQRTGEVRGLRKLSVTEALNVLPGTNAPPIDFYTGWFVYALPQGGVEMYPVLNNSAETVGAEIVWWSTTYGYGRYYIDTAPPANKLRATLVDGKVRLDWSGAGILQTASAVAGPYNSIPQAFQGYTYSGASPQFFRLVVQQ